MASIELQNFFAYYKQKKQYLVALNDIDLCVADGEFLVVIGPSGCGKTTLLKAIIGSLEHIDGKLLVNGIESQEAPTKTRNFGYVSQAFDLYKTMTIYDNIAFPLRILKVDVEEIEERVNKIAKDLNLTTLLTRKPRHLSVGQQQRVAIARALIRHPKALLFDEPFSNLDAPSRQEMRQLMKHIHQKYQVTTIFVTHDKDDAISLANRIVIMELGKIIFNDTKESLLMTPSNATYREYLYGT